MKIMIVRECSISDYNSICEINKCALGYDYPIEKTKEKLSQILKSQTNKIFVACIDDVVVGYIHGSDYECTYANSLKNLMAVAVDEAYQGKGVGKALLAAVENWAEECGCSGVRLVSGLNRTNAHEFYLHCGYNLRKQQKNFIKIFE